MTTPEAAGRRNQRAGRTWNDLCVTYCQAHGWPSAERQTRNGRNDLTGTGDIALECTIEEWAAIWRKLDQARRDADVRGLEWFAVWKKRNRRAGDLGAADPGRGAWVMPADVGMAMVQRLEALERLEIEAGEAYERGVSAGIRAEQQRAREAVAG